MNEYIVKFKYNSTDDTDDMTVMSASEYDALSIVYDYAKTDNITILSITVR